MNLGRIAVVVLTVGALGGCVASGPNDVTDNVPQVGVSYDTHNGIQSEAAILAAQSFLFPVLVAAYNDYSVTTTPPPEYDNLVYRRGYSLMGWSTSADIGSTWDYRGKLRPPPGWSMIFGDPALAVDPLQPSVVYYSNMGISDARWNALANGADEVPRSSFVVRPDGVCVAKSTNGGISFSAPVCIASPNANNFALDQDVIDRTTIAVDQLGRVYVGFIDNVPLNFNRDITVLRTMTAGDLSTFSPLPRAPFVGTSAPRLVTDPTGDVWLGSISGNGVVIERFRQAGTGWDQVINASTICGVPSISSTGQDSQMPFADTTIRGGHEYDFAVGQRPSGTGGFFLAPMVAFQVKRPLTGDRYVQVGFITSTATCTAGPTLSTIDAPGSQIMPSINYRTRNSAASSFDGEFWLAYYTTEGVVDPSARYLRVEAQRIQQLGTPALQFATFLAPADWFACLTNPLGTQGGFWGDYFDLTQIRDGQGTWWSVAAFTSSRGAPPCTSEGRPQHIAASRW